MHLSELLKANKSIPKRGFYVYAILENGTPCYIGKGKGNRVLQHFKSSSNQLLASKIRDNKNLYDWTVLECFDDEKECLSYEAQLIKSYKLNGVVLYNSAHYTSDRLNNEFLKGVFEIFKQFEERIFPIYPNEDIMPAIKRAEIMLHIINQRYKNAILKPIYKSRELTDLRCREIIVGNRCRVIIE